MPFRWLIVTNRWILCFPTAAELRLQHIAVAALAKSQELLYVPGVTAPIVLPEGSPGLRLLQRARNEAHALANIGYRCAPFKQVICTRRLFLRSPIHAFSSFVIAAR